MSDPQQDLLREFVIESYENLDRLDGELVALEDNPGSKEILSSIFRTIHTIKGTCGFLDFSKLEHLTHAGENLLSGLREGSVVMTKDITTALLSLVDAVRAMLANIEKDGREGDEAYDDLIRTLENLLETTPRIGQVLEASGLVDQRHIERAMELQKEGDERPLGEILIETAGLSEQQVKKALLAQDELANERGEVVKSTVTSQNIRVEVEQLDRLMNLAGELVLARNQILQIAAASSDSSTVATAQRLNLITSELQEGIMKIRMQPVGILWSKFPRIVRDLSVQLGKKVRLVMEGKGTELDKTLLEAIKDPLTHIVRNAVDHGIELPKERKLKGKSEEGTLLLRAYHESGQVNIEIIDDGRGIDIEAVKAKAVGQGLITKEQAGSMSDRQAVNLTFHPGLSTAQRVTNVSGRGVGMDVVKANIEEIGGTVEATSEFGHGTTIRIKIPLTLAIIPALIVTVGGDRYAIPQVSLVELVRLDGEAGAGGIEDLHGSPVYRLRGDLLPLVFLDEELRVADPDRSRSQARNLVVVRADEQQFGVVVDEINDTEEIVVKPLDRQTKSVTVYAGTTILGDGKVALIVDVMGLALRAHVVSEDRHDRSLEVDDDGAANGKSESISTYLLLQVGGGHRMAIRLSEVDRLEEFEQHQIEERIDGRVVQYRGEIMPLVGICEALGLPKQAEPDVLQVVVHSRQGQSIGLVVDAITDIVETSESVRRYSAHDGVEATVVIDKKVTDLVDLEAVVEQHFSSDVMRGSTSGARREQEEVQSTTSRQLCTFYLEDHFFGVDVKQVQEVLRHQTMTRVPLTAGVVEGLINLRGQTVTALDMRRRLGLSERVLRDDHSEDELPMNVVLRSRDGVVSILVDRIGDVVSVEDSDCAEVPETVEPGVRELLSEVYKLPDRILLLLDIERVVDINEPTLA